MLCRPISFQDQHVFEESRSASKRIWRARRNLSRARVRTRAAPFSAAGELVEWLPRTAAGWSTRTARSARTSRSARATASAGAPWRVSAPAMSSSTASGRRRRAPRTRQHALVGERVVAASEKALEGMRACAGRRGERRWRIIPSAVARRKHAAPVLSAANTTSSPGGQAERVADGDRHRHLAFRGQTGHGISITQITQVGEMQRSGARL